MPFEHYRQQTEERIRRMRRDLQGDNAEWIVQANTPFELQPENHKPKNGMLVIHGLFDSPFKMRDLATFYQQQGFLVQAILLEGHGTIPEHLQDIEYHQWIENTTNAINSLKKVVDNIYITGFSTGGILALRHCLLDDSIKGIVTLCPAIKLKTVISIGTHILNWTKRIIERDYWNKNNVEHDPTKYTTFPMNAPYQVANLADEFEALNKLHSLTTPLFMITSEDDETISGPQCFNYFSKTTNSHNRMIYYTNSEVQPDDSRISIETTYDATQHILDYSHICIPTSPSNQHYGIHGDYQSIIHYANKEDSTLYSGAISRQNLKKYNMQRLSYNPKFEAMCQQIALFLKTLSENDNQ